MEGVTHLLRKSLQCRTTWRPVNAGLVAMGRFNIFGVRPHPTEGGRVYAIAEASGVFEIRFTD